MFPTPTRILLGLLSSLNMVEDVGHIVDTLAIYRFAWPVVESKDSVSTRSCDIGHVNQHEFLPIFAILRKSSDDVPDVLVGCLLKL